MELPADRFVIGSTHMIASVNLRSLLEWQASRTPSSPAILAAGRPALTYGDWYGVAREADRVLQNAGICANDRLAVVVSNCPETAAAMVVLNSIAVVAPLDPASRGSELERAFLDLGATGVVVSATDGNAARAAALRLGLPVIELSSERGSPAGAFTLRCDRWTSAPSTPPNDTKVDFLARTSGTTGPSKQIGLTAANLLSAAEAFASAFALTPEDRCLHAQPVFHSAAIVTLAASMRAGSSIVYLPAFDPDAFSSSLRDDGVTWLSAPPATYREILAHIPAWRDVARAAKLRFLRSGSAALERGVLEEIEHVFEAPVLQCYGMTEAPFISSCPLPPLPRRAGSVGLPQRCEIAIVDDSGQHLGSEQMGEVVVRGPNVISGYDDPAVNAEAFADGWFRTGDLGRRDDDGYLYLLGRSKELINRGGQKIFPREIEDALREDDGIADAAIFGMPHPTLGEEVAAAVILQPDVMRTESELRRFAAERVADAKVPKRILIVPDFPRTPNGKVQRHQLQQLLPKQKSDGIGRNGRAVTLLEAQLLEAFEDVLGATGLRSDDDFFSCGGDSLRAARLIAAVRTLCGQDVTMQALFEAPTPKALAKHVFSALPAAATPLVRVQEGTKSVPLFFLNGDLDGGGVYMRHLARELDVERTVYSLSPHGTHGIPSLDTIEAMASDYASLIERACPEGPYLLGGYCNGGVVAYEIARTLRARGARVGPLLLIAASASNGPFGAIRFAVQVVARAFRWTAHQEFLWFRRVRERTVAFTLLRGAPPSAYATFVLEQAHRIARRARCAPPVVEQPVSGAYERSEAYKRMSQALARYFPGRYDGPVHHFWGHDDVPQFPGDPRMGWGEVAPQLVLHRVPGDHLTIVTGESEKLARIMRPLISHFD